MAPKKQHLVSQVVLRQFADAYGLLLRVNLEHGNIDHRFPAACMWEPDFVSAAPTEAEELWKSVEDRLPAALNAIDGDGIHNNAEAISVVKECMVLHFIRSHNIKLVTDASSKHASSEMRKQLVTKEKSELAAQFYKETHIYLVGTEGLKFAADKIMATIDPALSSPQEFWERLKVHFEDVKRWFAPLALEIFMPENPADEFLISDCPALPYRAGNLLGGFRGGVTLGEATAFYMPLGPRHVASLARAPLRHRLNREQVGQVNQTQAVNAFKQLCGRPTSGPIVRGAVRASE